MDRKKVMIMKRAHFKIPQEYFYFFAAQEKKFSLQTPSNHNAFYQHLKTSCAGQTLIQLQFSPWKSDSFKLYPFFSKSGPILK